MINVRDGNEKNPNSDSLEVKQIRSTETKLLHQEVSGIETLSGTSRKQRAAEHLDARERTGALALERADLNARGAIVKRESASTDDGGDILLAHVSRTNAYDAEDELVSDIADESACELEAENWRLDNLLSRVKQDAKEGVRRGALALGSAAIEAADPGEDGDSDVEEMRRAYNAPLEARRKLSHTAQRQINRQDRKLRKATNKMNAYRSSNQTFRANRQARKVARAQKKTKRWEKARKATSAKGIGGILLKVGLPMLLLSGLLIGMLLTLALCSAFESTKQGSWSDLNENENAVALYLLSKEMDEVHVAAIMGNMYAESGIDPSAVEAGSGAGHGLIQWSFGRWNQLEEYAGSQNRSWTDIRLQMDFFWKEYCDDPQDQNFARYQWSLDVYTGEEYNHKMFESEGDIEVATTMFRKCFERAGVFADEKRIDAAKRYYSILMSSPDGAGGLGEDYANATAKQQALVNAAYETPFYQDGWCATWVTNVFNKAGYPPPGGDACDMARSWWCSSTDRADLKVGMVIAVESAPNGLGVLLGHVGIYIGDNKVMHNELASTGNVPNGVTISDLDAWIDFYENNCKAHWGWALGFKLD